ncbi:hypothetical protein SAMN05216390_108114 [Lachnospiraceae bacterium KH1T2]|nr:hypothetical protein SAMN05216390_108114 [Lachnospiraceae bacterium KH1T2]
MNFNIESCRWYIEGGFAWFITYEWEILIKIDLKEMRIVSLWCIPGNWEKSQGRYSKCMKLRNKVICFPNFSDDIYILDLQKKMWKRKTVLTSSITELRVSDVFKKKNDIYFVARGEKRIYSFDKKGNIIEKYQIHDDNIGFGEFDNNKYRVVAQESGILFEIDETEKKEILLNEKLWSVVSFNDSVYVNSFFGNIYVVEGKAVTLIREEKRENRCGDADFPVYFNSVRVGTYICFIPYRNDKILIYDTSQKIFFYINIVDEKGEGHFVYCCSLDERYIVIFSSETEKYIKVDIDKKTYSFISIEVDEDVYRELSSILFEKGRIISEGCIVESREFHLDNMLSIWR